MFSCIVLSVLPFLHSQVTSQEAAAITAAALKLNGGEQGDGCTSIIHVFGMILQSSHRFLNRSS